MLDYIDSALLDKLRYAEPEAARAIEEAGLKRAAISQKPQDAVSVKQGFAKSAVGYVQKINKKMNEALDSLPGSKIAMKGLQHYNLIMELASYNEAFDKEGITGLATELFRRRIPGGSLIENIMLENYYAAAWDGLVLIFPALGLVDAAIGVAGFVYDQADAYYWGKEAELFTDTLYDGAVFKLVAVEKSKDARIGRWELYSVKYKGAEFLRENIYRKIETKKVEKGRLSREELVNKAYDLMSWSEVDNMLRKTIASCEPGLAFLEQLMK
ncbi:MAG: hypothetical protein NC914_01225, partial [Candidatus Omnitrophica bacterium]|nr:hypothetical protein [Candidatus Omnitrophota bacterium]